MNTIRICNSCTKINASVEDTEAFREAVRKGLELKRPDMSWQVEASPCLKLCPLDRISMTVSTPAIEPDARITMSREANVESVVSEVLSFFRPLKPDQDK